MSALLSAWLGMIALACSLTMVVYRPAFNDVMVLINLYFISPLALTLAGLVLWSTRKRAAEFAAARLQAKVGAVLALAAAALIYMLVAGAQRLSAA